MYWGLKFWTTSMQWPWEEANEMKKAYDAYEIARYEK